MSLGAQHQIHIEQLKLSARIGVSKKERAKPQRLLANITVWPARDLRDLNDAVGRTVDYSALSVEIKAFVREQSSKLLETLANQLAKHLLQRFAISKVAVEIRKFAIREAAYAAVTVIQGASLD